jgi:hypothetical protein
VCIGPSWRTVLHQRCCSQQDNLFRTPRKGRAVSEERVSARLEIKQKGGHARPPGKVCGMTVKSSVASCRRFPYAAYRAAHLSGRHRIRILYRCWQERTPYDESTYLMAPHPISTTTFDSREASGRPRARWRRAIRIHGAPAMRILNASIEWSITALD